MKSQLPGCNLISYALLSPKHKMYLEKHERIIKRQRTALNEAEFIEFNERLKRLRG